MEQLPLSLDFAIASNREMARAALRRASPKEVAYYARVDADSLQRRAEQYAANARST